MKALLPKAVISLFIMICAIHFQQQSSSGIYFTSNDYIYHKLHFADSSAAKNHTEVATDVSSPSGKIVIKRNNITYRYPKDSVYAIKYSDGTIIRIYKNAEYLLINPDEKILIYKAMIGPAGKNGSPKIKYYFSKDAKSNIQELTIHNVKAAFPDNQKFHDLVDLEFPTDLALTSYDDFQKMMKINHVLNNSLVE